MATGTECPGCGARLAIGPALHGRQVRCQGCGQVFVAGEAAPGEALPWPRRDSRDRPVGLIVGLCVGAGLLLVGAFVVLIAVLARADAEEAEAVAWQPPPAQPPQPVIIPFPPVAQPPAPQNNIPVGGDPITRAVAQLKSDSAFQQADGARDLEKMAVHPQRRAEVVAALKGVVENRRPLIPRGAATRTLGVWGTGREVPYLIRLTDDGDPGVQEAAIVALGRLRDARAADVLALRLANNRQRNAASEALKNLGPVAEPAVRQQLDSPDGRVRVEVCKILKVIGTRASYPALVRLANDEDQGVAAAAREALPPAERPPVWGPRQTMRLNVKVVNIHAWPALEAKLKALADDPHPRYKVHTSGDYKWVDLAPVNSDAEAFARRIPFGRIVAVHNDQRLIYVDSGQ
jgi:hypothetical protein